MKVEKIYHTIDISLLSRRTIVFIPQRRGSLEPSPRGPFWFECSLSLYVIGQILFGFPLGTRLTYCVVGGWVVGAAWGVFWIIWQKTYYLP